MGVKYFDVIHEYLRDTKVPAKNLTLKFNCADVLIFLAREKAVAPERLAKIKHFFRDVLEKHVIGGGSAQMSIALKYFADFGDKNDLKLIEDLVRANRLKWDGSTKEAIRKR